MVNMKEINEALPDDDANDPDFAHVDKAEMLKALGQLGNNAGLIGALQHKLDDLVGMSSGFVESLHYKVRARVGALTEAQETHDELYGKFLEEKRALEDKYAKLYRPLYATRAAIVKGTKDVDAEPIEGDDVEEEAPQGIPEFWLCALRNHELLGEQITEKDADALKHLVDITSRPLTKDDFPKDEDDEEEDEEEEDEEPTGFALEFHFEPNDFFEDAVLTKKYLMADMDDPILEHSKGNAIMQARNAKGLTQKQLATQLQVQPQVINEYESGKAIPNNQIIAKIERALGAKLPRAPKK